VKIILYCQQRKLRCMHVVALRCKEAAAVRNLSLFIVFLKIFSETTWLIAMVSAALIRCHCGITVVTVGVLPNGLLNGKLWY
jgi:hypothetical protein